MVSARNRLLFLSGEFSRTLPCGVVLTGILCVLLPAFLLPDAELAVILIPPLASLAALWCFGPRDAAFTFALPCLLAMFSLIWHTERYEPNLFRNIAGNKVQDIFGNAVRYFRKR